MMMVATLQAQRVYEKVGHRMLMVVLSCLNLSWVVTVHELQGTTLDKAVIDLGK